VSLRFFTLYVTSSLMFLSWSSFDKTRYSTVVPVALQYTGTVVLL
jgi:hypothetical protein